MQTNWCRSSAELPGGIPVGISSVVVPGGMDITMNNLGYTFLDPTVVYLPMGIYT